MKMDSFELRINRITDVYKFSLHTASFTNVSLADLTRRNRSEPWDTLALRCFNEVRENFLQFKTSFPVYS